MADLSTEERSKLAVRLVEQAPPGEVNDVINDIRTIIGDDQALMPLILPSIRAYNLEQLTAVEHPEENGVPAHCSLLSEAAIVPGEEQERYIDAVGKRSFAFDHASNTASDYQPYVLPEEEETFRSELAKSLAAYTKNHFPSGQSSVSCSQYPLLPAESEQPPVSAQQDASKDVPVASDASADKSADEEKLDTVPPPHHDPAGDLEPVPTPMTGDVKASMAGNAENDKEVDQPGGLEKLDEEIEQEKEKEENEQTEQATESVEPSSASTDPAVPETVVEAPEAETPATAPASARKQEKLDNPVYTLEVVGNRYNPSNFWTGRWRTRWVVDQAKGSVDGKILVDVHYYEQGNVQLAAKHAASFPVPQASGSQSIASQIVTTIAKMEAAYQMELNDAYEDLGDKAFRALRRALPVTRQKMDWDKVSGYSLGADISKARA